MLPFNVHVHILILPPIKMYLGLLLVIIFEKPYKAIALMSYFMHFKLFISKESIIFAAETNMQKPIKQTKHLFNKPTETRCSSKCVWKFLCINSRI